MTKKKSSQPSLSVVLIVKDEETLLPRCLESLQYGSKPHLKNKDLIIPKHIYNELVVIDTGSTDKTVDVAKAFGAKVYNFKWVDDMSAARNFAESKCTGKYIFWQDADEILVEGHEVIREIVEAGVEEGVAPYMTFPNGTCYFRQELLHKNNGQWRWEGALHEYLCGPSSRQEKRIVQMHLAPAVDRPTVHDPIAALYSNLGKGFGERHMFYLLREYFYSGRWQTVIALADLLLKQPAEWQHQRSHACILKGDAYGNLGDTEKQISAYLDAIQEWPNWAEPYYALGKVYYEKGNWTLGATWYFACLAHNPPVGGFVEASIYKYLRYDQLAVCLHRLGRNTEALQYGLLALEALPGDKRLQANINWYKEGILHHTQVPLFRELDIETHGYCNRKCNTCLRQTYPDRSVLSSRGRKVTKDNWLPSEVVYRLIDEAADIGFTGMLCLNYFNEPLYDERLGDFAKYAKEKGVFSLVYANTNGDLLTEELANKLDGCFDQLNISIYGGDKEALQKKYSSWFKETSLTWGGGHIVTHYSPFSNFQECLNISFAQPCTYEARHRMIITYTGEMSMCCEDIGHVFDLGNVKDSSLKELWFNPKHIEILKTLVVPGGREKYPYCRICPRSDYPV